MPQQWEPHPDEETLEAYLMGRLAFSRFEVVEMHLLVCERCRGRVARTERFVKTMRNTVARPPRALEEPLPEILVNPEGD